MPVKKTEEGTQKAKPKKSSSPKRVPKMTSGDEQAIEPKTTKAPKSPAPIKVSQPRVAPQVLAEPPKETTRAPITGEVKTLQPVQEENARPKPRAPQAGSRTNNKSTAPTPEASVSLVELATATTSQNLKLHAPNQDEISFRAWEIWQSEGCPHGRESEHWFRAESELKSKRT